MMFFNCVKSNKLKSFVNIITPKIAIEPPKTADKKGLNRCRQMLDKKWPNMLEGAIIKAYLNAVLIKFILRLGIVFLIFLKFNNDIIVIDKK